MFQVKNMHLLYQTTGVILIGLLDGFWLRSAVVFILYDTPWILFLKNFILLCILKHMRSSIKQLSGNVNTFHNVSAAVRMKSIITWSVFILFFPPWFLSVYNTYFIDEFILAALRLLGQRISSNEEISEASSSKYFVLNCSSYFQNALKSSAHYQCELIASGYWRIFWSMFS